MRALTARARPQEVGTASIRSEHGDDDSLRTAVERAGSVALISSYRHQRIAGTALRWLVAALQAEGIPVIVIDSSAMEPSDSFGAEKLLWRENRGFDFASWFTAFERHDDVMAACDRMYLLNDSCVGPLDGLGAMLERGWSLDAGVWSCTDSWDHGYHLQSYFLAVGTVALRGGAVRRFAEAYTYPVDKRDVIIEGELALSRHLLHEGIELAAVHPYDVLAERFLDTFAANISRKMGDPTVRSLRAVDRSYVPPDVEAMTGILESIRAGRTLNPTHSFWRQLLDDGCPFVKRDLLDRDPVAIRDHAEIFEAMVRAGSDRSLDVMRAELRTRDVGRVQSLKM